MRDLLRAVYLGGNQTSLPGAFFPGDPSAVIPHQSPSWFSVGWFWPLLATQPPVPDCWPKILAWGLYAAPCLSSSSPICCCPCFCLATCLLQPGAAQLVQTPVSDRALRAVVFHSDSYTSGSRGSLRNNTQLINISTLNIFRTQKNMLKGWFSERTPPLKITWLEWWSLPSSPDLLLTGTTSEKDLGATPSFYSS